MSEIELKPCPFCGGEARFASESDTVVFVTCKKCHVETRGVGVSAYYCANDIAAKLWNDRVHVHHSCKSWIKHGNVQAGSADLPIGKCPYCKFKVCDILNSMELYSYCPNCGAKMEG